MSKGYFLALQVLPWSKRDRESPCEDLGIVPTCCASAHVAQLFASAKAVDCFKARRGLALSGRLGCGVALESGTQGTVPAAGCSVDEVGAALETLPRALCFGGM